MNKNEFKISIIKKEPTVFVGLKKSDFIDKLYLPFKVSAKRKPAIKMP